MSVIEICDFNFVPNLWIFNAALCYYAIEVDYFLPFLHSFNFFNFELCIYALSLATTIGKGIILAQIFALEYVYTVCLDQTQADDITR